MIALITALFIAEMGIKNGALNQVFYLLEGLHRADPEFARGDWYTERTTSYHFVWNTAVAAFARWGVLEEALTIGTVIMTSAFCVALYAVIAALWERPLLPWALALLLFAGFFTRGLGDFDLIPTSVEPFGISNVAVVVGLAFLAWQRPFAAGVSFGIAALMHSHIALLMTGVLGLSTVAWMRPSRNGSRKWPLWVWIPFLAIGLPGLLPVFTAAADPSGAEAFQVLREMAPQHYFPLESDWRPLVLFAATLTMGTAGAILRPPAWNVPLAVPVLSAAAIVILSLLAGSIDAFWFVNRALPWRLATFVMLAGVVLGAAALANAGSWRSGRERLNRVGSTLAIISISLFAVGGTLRLWLALAVVVAAVVTILVSNRGVSRLDPRRGRAVAVALVACGMAPVAWREIGRSHVALQLTDPVRRDLYAWVRSTQPGTVFATPPGWKDFRLLTGRATVVDWSATPMYSAEMLEWQRRTRDVTGVERPRSLAQVRDGYRNGLTCARLDSLRIRYGVRFAILEPDVTPPPCASVAYADSSGKVVAVD